MGRYHERIRAIEISFPVPIHLPDTMQRRLDELAADICALWEAHHPHRVMWPAGLGQKLLTNPFASDTMEFDEAVFHIEVDEREAFADERHRRERAKWNAEALRHRAQHEDAASIVWIGWRLRIALILWRRPFRWTARQGWSYSRALLASALYDWRDGREDWLAAPREALDLDRQYWEA